MVEIYSYQDLASYLSDKFKEKKEINPSFSIRSWAMQLGNCSHGTLHGMLSGKRAVSKSMVPIFVKNLKLKAEEAIFFELLANYSRAKTLEEKSFYEEKMREVSPKPLRPFKDVMVYKYIVDPLHFIISEMVGLKNFNSKSFHIKQRLRIDANLKDIEDSIQRLISLGILERDGERLKRSIGHLFTAADIPNTAIQTFHRNMSQIAAEQISEQSVDDREYAAISFNIKKKDLPKLKKRLRELSNAIIEEFESQDGDETYHLNLQLFSLTK